MLSLLGLALLVLGYWAIVAHIPGHRHEPKVLLRLIRDAIPSACVGVVVYLIVNYLLYQQQVESARQYGNELVQLFIEALGDQHTGLRRLVGERGHFDWGALIGSTKAITIVTRYWDDEATDHRRAFMDFFKNGGVLTLFIPDPRDQATRELSAVQRSSDLEPHDYQIAFRILRTIVELRAAALNASRELEHSGQAAVRIEERLKVRYLVHAPNYELHKFGASDIILTPYPHFFMPESLCPGMWFDLRYADEMREFIVCELRLLTEKRSVEASLDEAFQLYAALRKVEPIFDRLATAIQD